MEVGISFELWVYYANILTIKIDWFFVFSFLFLFIQFVVGLSVVSRWHTNENPTNKTFIPHSFIFTVSYSAGIELTLKRNIISSKFREMGENVSTHL